MTKGVIMQIEKRHLIVLTQDGHFLQAEKPSYSITVGEEIEVIPYKGKRFGLSGQFVHWPASFAVIAVLLLSFYLIYLSFNREPYAYLSVDINPSLMISVNSNGEAQHIEPLNEEAVILLSALGDWKGNSMESVMNEIMEISEEKGYLLNRVDSIIVSSVFTNQADSSFQSSFNSEIQQWKNDMIINHQLAAITLYEASLKDLEQANEHGMSVGKWMNHRASSTENHSSEVKIKEPYHEPTPRLDILPTPLQPEASSIKGQSAEPVPEASKEVQPAEEIQEPENTPNNQTNGAPVAIPGSTNEKSPQNQATQNQQTNQNQIEQGRNKPEDQGNETYDKNNENEEKWKESEEVKEEKRKEKEDRKEERNEDKEEKKEERKEDKRKEKEEKKEEKREYRDNKDDE
ncbi:anti-sigma factor domain-containing protein [Jeotgalibacillus soli]|uniref:RsgI N-terminal anti-sigma domain-containing protein n=1 Tax=Jeotgalibacillus soli TaxID=889306 RepID=A0A0C2VPC0_9BACL|nr:anti-sigma factor domain-containing protein [Jeotgalibacillus soli]KIL45858.1 hypothetical protein KP78_22070 [Jeotgalibacillus soli]